MSNAFSPGSNILGLEVFPTGLFFRGGPVSGSESEF